MKDVQLDAGKITERGTGKTKAVQIIRVHITHRRPRRAAVGGVDEIIRCGECAAAEPALVGADKTDALQFKRPRRTNGGKRDAIRDPRFAAVGGFVEDERTVGIILLERDVADVRRRPGHFPKITIGHGDGSHHLPIQAAVRRARDAAVIGRREIRVCVHAHGEAEIGVHKINIHQPAHHACRREIRDPPRRAAILGLREIRRAAHAPHAVDMLWILDVDGAETFHAGIVDGRHDAPGAAAVERFVEQIRIRDAAVVRAGAEVADPAVQRRGETDRAKVRDVRDEVRRDGEPALAVIRRAINPVLAARAPAIREVGEIDVVVTEISRADGRVGKLRPHRRLGKTRDDGAKRHGDCEKFLNHGNLV